MVIIGKFYIKNMLWNFEVTFTTIYYSANEKAVELLLQHRVNINQPIKDGLTALHMAATKGD